MKRWMPVGIVLVLAAMGAVLLSGTAIAPEDFTGEWCSAENGSTYRFQEGIVQCQEHCLALPDGEAFSGAYSFTRDSILLFALDLEGLETEKQLYLVAHQDGNRLCENRDGSGSVYFYRKKP